MAYIPTGITSIVSTVPSSVQVGASIMGLAPVEVKNTNINVGGSVVAYITSNPSISGAVDVNNFPTNQNVSGSVASYPLGTIITSLVSTVPSSVIVGASVFGHAPVVIVGGSIATATTNSSVQVLNFPVTQNISGSVAALQGTNPYIFTGSVQGAVSVLGHAPIVIVGGSIVGTYSEDSGHTTADKGIFALGVRNDALSSITSADLDYSPHAVGPTGETIVAVAPFTKGIQGTGDLRTSQGASVTVIVAQGASVFSYIRAAQLANMGSASVLVTFAGGLGSILSYTIAPAGGGSNIKFDPWLKTGANSAFTASISGAASVLVSAQGFIAKE